MDDFVMKKKKSDTEEGEKDKEGERSDSDTAETVSKSMPTSSASASAEDLETIKLHEGTRQHKNASKDKKKQRHACADLNTDTTFGSFLR